MNICFLEDQMIAEVVGGQKLLDKDVAIPPKGSLAPERIVYFASEQAEKDFLKANTNWTLTEFKPRTKGFR